jgi:hypothetical protein
MLLTFTAVLSFLLCNYIPVILHYGYSILLYSSFRRELLHSYGFEHIAMLNNLEKAGLLKKQV